MVDSKSLECRACCRIPTSKGDFYLYIYQAAICDGIQHLVYVYDEALNAHLNSKKESPSMQSDFLIGLELGQKAAKTLNNDLESSYRIPKCLNDFLLSYSDNGTSKGFNGDNELLVRIHSQCITSEVFGSCRCDCRLQLEGAMEQIFQAGRGIIIYLAQEGRGIGLEEKMRAYNLQDQGFDTLDANLILGHDIDCREYSAAIAILRDFTGEESTNLKIRLMTNNPDKVEALSTAGFNVQREPLQIDAATTTGNFLSSSWELIRYLDCKKNRMNHA